MAHLPHPSWMNMHCSRLQIRVTDTSHLHNQDIRLQICGIRNRDPIFSIREMHCPWIQKPRQQHLLRRFSIFFCAVSRHKRPHPHARPHAGTGPCRNSQYIMYKRKVSNWKGKGGGWLVEGEQHPPTVYANDLHISNIEKTQVVKWKEITHPPEPLTQSRRSGLKAKNTMFSSALF